MEKLGVLVVSYGAREAAMVDALSKSTNYLIDIYVVDKQRNPFNIKKSVEHVVIPDLNVNEICKFVNKRRDKLNFVVVGPEKPIIEGLRDLVEKETGVPVICPTKRYALEGSKAEQRLLLQKILPEANPRFKIFDQSLYENLDALKRELVNWLDELNNQVAVKPDKPAAGKGVGVWGDHFTTREDLLKHFFENLKYGKVIVEEKVEGEESSFQAFCDGKHLIPLPDTRDYKRAFDEDKGPNTGGMGSYKDVEDNLPFLTPKDREKEVEMAERIFNELRKSQDAEHGLKGMPFYIAFIHTKYGPKILEINSRPGDPEIQNILPILKDDFAEICLKIIDGSLNKIDVEKKASVVVYKVPPSYGNFAETYPNLVNKEELGKPIDLKEAEELAKVYDGQLKIYPASVEQREDGIYPLKSRAICTVGIADNIEEAREIAYKGINAIKGGSLWFRKDIASKDHIERSIQHMKKLRGY
ncbi:MAG: hypothetical protein DRJ31_05210 [Candidatus Methanomethylicota archaeon]|uniref:phosphoribosylamine--glycine ligase n=3 Tax=Thermoproteota archaeon TaxID=2056631 RepID=A0A497EPN8_9CREN|nr:MAG: hypothetical protein DRJ31_05210 [Candidatus Verstraetearchaeota archaeon]